MIRQNKKEKWIREGECKRCGGCCQVRTIMQGMGIIEMLVISLFKPKFILVWLFKGKCPHLAFNSKGQAYCKIYSKRPQFCQLYPAEPADLIKSCGYWFK